MSLQDKIAAILAEGSKVPGTDAILGTKVAEKLKDGSEGDSAGSKTGNIEAKYDKSTKQPTLDNPAKGSDSVDAKAASDTAKIKKDYTPTSQPKLKAEAFEALFAGEELTEEFKTKAEAIFEAAVEQVAEAKIAALQEEYQVKLDEAVEAVKGELVEQIDGYLDHVVEEWMKDNAVALESGIKVEMASSFMEGLKNVFEEHYIDVPESKIDVIKEQAQEIETLEAQLAEAAETAQAAIVESKILKAEAIIAEASVGLTAIQAEKLYSLAENVDYDTEEEFTAKVAALKESYFRKDAASKDVIPTQEKTQIQENKTHSDVDAVLKALRQDSLKLIRSSN